MAIGKRNSGFFKQDAVMGKLNADARKPYKVNAVVAQALEQGKRRKAYLEERAKNHVPRFVKQYSVSLNGPGSDVRAFLGKKKDMKKAGILVGLVIVLLVVGEIRCIYKAITCNWEPIGKAEIVYTGSALTGIGCIVGWIDIEDK